MTQKSVIIIIVGVGSNYHDYWLVFIYFTTFCVSYKYILSINGKLWMKPPFILTLLQVIAHTGSLTSKLPMHMFSSYLSSPCFNFKNTQWKQCKCWKNSNVDYAEWSHHGGLAQTGFSSRCPGCCRARCRRLGCTAGGCAWSLGSLWCVSSECVPGPSLSCVSFEGVGCWRASSFVCILPVVHIASSIHPRHWLQKSFPSS